MFFYLHKETRKDIAQENRQSSFKVLQTEGVTAVGVRLNNIDFLISQSCPMASPVHPARNILFKYIPPNHPCPSDPLASTHHMHLSCCSSGPPTDTHLFPALHQLPELTPRNIKLGTLPHETSVAPN